MGRKRGCPSVGFPPATVPDNWPHHWRALAFTPTFHLTTTHCSAAGREEPWRSQWEEKPGGSDPGNPATQPNSDSESLWLVSFGHNPFLLPLSSPTLGEGGERGDRYLKWAHVLPGARLGWRGLVRRAGVAKLSVDALGENSGHYKPGPTGPTLPTPHSGFLFNTPRTYHTVLP